MIIFEIITKYMTIHQFAYAGFMFKQCVTCSKIKMHLSWNSFQICFQYFTMKYLSQIVIMYPVFQPVSITWALKLEQFNVY